MLITFTSYKKTRNLRIWPPDLLQCQSIVCGQIFESVNVEEQAVTACESNGGLTMFCSSDRCITSANLVFAASKVAGLSINFCWGLRVPESMFWDAIPNLSAKLSQIYGTAKEWPGFWMAFQV
jgi:hypothetical protein